MMIVYQAPLTLLVVFLLAIAAAAVEDGWRRRVSNLAVLAVALSGIAAFFVTGHAVRLWEPLLAVVAVFALGTLLFARGVVGGGDVKLLAAACFWYTGRGLITFISAVFIAGGVLALCSIALRVARGGKIKGGSGLPYAIAIAAGALWTVATTRFL